MQRAIELARLTSIVEKAGGPFGCVIVKDGSIIAEGANRVLAEQDPTCHGEMVAIRAACEAIGSHDLSGCTLYTSGEPCPMCYGACWWARIDKIYFASTIDDAKEFGDFDDSRMIDALKLPTAQRPLQGNELMREEMLKLWKEFRDCSKQIHY